jgi:hypothetical protein
MFRGDVRTDYILFSREWRKLSVAVGLVIRRNVSFGAVVKRVTGGVFTRDVCRVSLMSASPNMKNFKKAQRMRTTES